jgi:16S rRNA (cytosine1402-N4)-methyltransferase
LVVITFHSIEDRIVKHTFRKWCVDNSPKEVPVFYKPSFSLINNHFIKASEEEIKNNKRSRSAILRGVVKND